MIKFYFMEGCGFCNKAKTELADEIKKGTVKVVSSNQAPTGVNGFPHFVNESNGKSHSGFAPKEVLFGKLEVMVVENFSFEGFEKKDGLSQSWIGVL